MNRILIKSILIALFALKQISAANINQTLLFKKYGYNKDSVIIDLSEKSIEIIDINTFQGLKNLEILFLDENKIRRLEYVLFYGLENIREIWLESNLIISVNKDIFEGLNKLEKVCFNENPISFLFPNNTKQLCEKHPNCTIKINEKCIKIITSI
jgi:Leucine-rich repeat (LRR) protein